MTPSNIHLLANRQRRVRARIRRDVGRPQATALSHSRCAATPRPPEGGRVGAIKIRVSNETVISQRPHLKPASSATIPWCPQNRGRLTPRYYATAQPALDPLFHSAPDCAALLLFPVPWHRDYGWRSATPRCTPVDTYRTDHSQRHSTGVPRREQKLHDSSCDG